MMKYKDKPIDEMDYPELRAAEAEIEREIGILKILLGEITKLIGKKADEEYTDDELDYFRS